MLLGGKIAGLVINILCLILLVGTVIYLIVAWGSLPDQIPGHFGGDGQITRYGSKGTLIIPLVIAWLLYLGFLVIERVPQIWNTGVRVTEENKYRVYGTIRSLLSTVKLIICAVFAFITIIASQSQNLPSWFLGVFIQFLLVTLIIHIFWLFKVR